MYVVTLNLAFVLAGFILRRLMENNMSQPQLSKQQTLMALCLRSFCPCDEIQKGSVCLGTMTTSISLAPQELSEDFTG